MDWWKQSIDFQTTDFDGDSTSSKSIQSHQLSNSTTYGNSKEIMHLLDI